MLQFTAILYDIRKTYMIFFIILNVIEGILEFLNNFMENVQVFLKGCHKIILEILIFRIELKNDKKYHISFFTLF